MVRTRRWWMALRLPNLPHLGQGALRGAHRTGSVRTWGADGLHDLRAPVGLGRHLQARRSYILMSRGLTMPRVLAASARSLQIVRSGRRLIYRLLSWNPSQGAFLRLVERLQGCWLW